MRMTLKPFEGGGVAKILTYTKEEAPPIRKTLGIEEEDGFPCLEVHYLGDVVVLAVNCTEERVP